MGDAPLPISYTWGEDECTSPRGEELPQPEDNVPIVQWEQPVVETNAELAWRLFCIEQRPYTNDDDRCDINYQIIVQWLDLFFPDHGCRNLTMVRNWFYRFNFVPHHGGALAHCVICTTYLTVYNLIDQGAAPPAVLYMWYVRPCDDSCVALWMDPGDWRRAYNLWSGFPSVLPFRTFQPKTYKR